jgi:hypothetical protein
VHRSVGFRLRCHTQPFEPGLVRGRHVLEVQVDGDAIRLAFVGGAVGLTLGRPFELVGPPDAELLLALS